MIKIHGTRARDGQVIPDVPALREVDLERAFKTLVDGELKFGGRVVNATETSLEIQTRIMGSTIDTTYFEGPEEEMANLLAIALSYEKELSENRDEIFNEAYAELQRKGGDRVTGSPFFLTHMGPLLIGESTLNRAVKKIMQES